jgi:hypothetical protein
MSIRLWKDWTSVSIESVKRTFTDQSASYDRILQKWQESTTSTSYSKVNGSLAQRFQAVTHVKEVREMHWYASFGSQRSALTLTIDTETRLSKSEVFTTEKRSTTRCVSLNKIDVLYSMQHIESLYGGGYLTLHINFPRKIKIPKPKSQSQPQIVKFSNFLINLCNFITTR